MTSEEKQPIPPEDAYPELMDEDLAKDAALEELILEDNAVSPPTETAPPLSASESVEVVSKLQHELEVARQQIKDKEENYIRLYADFENFRRRTQREKEEIVQLEKKKLIVEVLPIVDNFERAQQHVKLETDREREIHNSYQSVYRLLVESLKKLGVSRMKAVGQPFDPNLHEAIARQPSNELPEDTVLVEYQPGYKLGDLVIRHAMVTVSEPGSGMAGAPEVVTETTLDSEPVTEVTATEPEILPEILEDETQTPQ